MSQTTIVIRLRELREGRGWSQSELARRSGVPHPTISRIEARKTSGISFATLDNLAHALEIHPAVLIERRDTEMVDTNNIKMQIMRLVAEGRADDAWEYAEAIRGELTEDQLSELELWIAQNAYEAFRPPAEAVASRGKWLEVTGHLKEGETLRDAFPRLPKDLQTFLKREAERSKKQ